MLTKTIVTAALAASLAFGIGLPAHSAQSTSVRSHELMRSEVDFVAPSPGVFPFRDLPNAIFRLPHPTDRAGTLEEAWAANDAGPRALRRTGAGVGRTATGTATGSKTPE